jgi:hypothetical protein
MIYLLLTHIALGSALVVTFIIRLIGILSSKISKTSLKAYAPILGSGVVVSGIALGVITKSSISSVCLSSIVIISLIMVAEYVLQKLPVSNK